MSIQPKAAELGGAAAKISDILFEMSKQMLAQKAAVSAARSRGGLLAADIDVEPLEPLIDAVRANAHSDIRSIPAVRWLTREPCYMDLVKAFGQRASASPSSKFAEPDAIWRMASCALMSLYLVRWYREKSREPLEMSKDDWVEAQKALQTLVRLRRAKGLDVSRILCGDGLMRALPLNWEDGSLKRLQQGQLHATKPCPDGKVAERKALKAFAVALHREFGAAPALVVARFGDLIDYSPTSIKRNIPRWIAEASKGAVML